MTESNGTAELKDQPATEEAPTTAAPVVTAVPEVKIPRKFVDKPFPVGYSLEPTSYSRQTVYFYISSSGIAYLLACLLTHLQKPSWLPIILF
jgi:hypothetical protein